MADHAELVKEMVELEKLSSQERLKLAKNRRQKQLKKFAEYEKKCDKQEKNANKRKTKALSAIHASNHNAGHGKNKTHSFPQAEDIQVSKPCQRVAFDKGVILLEAAARNDVMEVRSLLKDGVNPDVANEDGLTALHQCCIDDSEDMLKILLEFGANVNSKDSELWTPLHAAATCGHLKICQHLVNNSADLLAVNADGNMPYDICDDVTTLEYIETEMAKQDVTQELIDETRQITELRMLNEIKEYENEGNTLHSWTDRIGATLLHIAAANGYYDVASYIMPRGCDVNIKDNDGWTPAMAAACWGQIPVLELLAQNGADLEVKTKDNKSLVDLVDDDEVKNQINEIKQETKVNMERFRRANSDVKRRSSTNIRSSGAGNTGSMYNSNTSLSERNPFSSSVRRHSMREKHKLSMQEARDEARYRISINTEDADSSTPTTPADSPIDGQKEMLPVTNIDDIEMTVDNNITTINITDKSKSSATPASEPSHINTADNNRIEGPPAEPQPKLVATIQINADNDSSKSEAKSTEFSEPIENGDKNRNQAKIRIDSLKASSDDQDKEGDSDNTTQQKARFEQSRISSSNTNPVSHHQEPALKRYTSYGQPTSEQHVNERRNKNCCTIL